MGAFSHATLSGPLYVAKFYNCAQICSHGMGDVTNADPLIDKITFFMCLTFDESIFKILMILTWSGENY
jgi:hypothetical protein